MRYFYFLWPFSPLLVSIIYALSSLIKRYNINIIFILIALSLSLINYTRIPTSDLASYYSIFESLEDINFIHFFTYVPIDYIFYFISMILVKLFNSVHITTLFWTFVIYFTYFKALEKVNENYLDNSLRLLILAVFYSFTMVIVFSMSSHLVRQFVAASILIYIIVSVNSGTGNNKETKLLFVLASFIHFSILLFLPLFFIRKINRNILIILIPFFLIISFLVGHVNILLILSDIFKETNYTFISELLLRIHLYVDKNDGNIQLGAYIKLLSFFLFSWVLLLYSRKYSFISLSFIYLIIILVLFRNTDLILFRYYFYAQFFYGIFILIFLREFNNKYINTLFFFYILYALLKFFRNIIDGSWQYISNDFSLLYLNIFDYLTYWNS